MLKNTGNGFVYIILALKLLRKRKKRNFWALQFVTLFPNINDKMTNTGAEGRILDLGTDHNMK